MTNDRPRCTCGDFVLDGHLTCGRLACDEAGARARRDAEFRQQLAVDDPIQFVAEELVGHGPMEVTFRPETVVTLVGLLQLALRHPGVQEYGRDVAARFIGGAREYFADCPTVLALMDLGDDPRNDQ